MWRWFLYVSCGDNSSHIPSTRNRIGKDMSDKGNTRNSSKKDFNEIEETVVSVSRRGHDQLNRPRKFKLNIGDLANNSSDYDHET